MQHFGYSTTHRNFDLVRWWWLLKAGIVLPNYNPADQATRQICVLHLPFFLKIGKWIECNPPDERMMCVLCPHTTYMATKLSIRFYSIDGPVDTKVTYVCVSGNTRSMGAQNVTHLGPCDWDHAMPLPSTLLGNLCSCLEAEHRFHYVWTQSNIPLFLFLFYWMLSLICFEVNLSIDNIASDKCTLTLLRCSFFARSRSYNNCDRPP